ncbi:hypothetical protein [Mesorhizobium sp. LSHC412B00]|uniref:hypothetical protein n=1 Tax=Mesorhizobium sp. LSHC412B00 TaxID=1287285 RepID=UPI0018DC66A8|nr:hypothetical protein [Mesorhizobium sp. LSHC412B00]
MIQLLKIFCDVMRIATFQWHGDRRHPCAAHRAKAGHPLGGSIGAASLSPLATLSRQRGE